MTSKPKYGPTPEYGPCETEACESDARSTCEACNGDFCYGHAPHPVHSPASGAQPDPAAPGRLDVL